MRTGTDGKKKERDRKKLFLKNGNAREKHPGA